MNTDINKQSSFISLISWTTRSSKLRLIELGLEIETLSSQPTGILVVLYNNIM